MGRTPGLGRGRWRGAAWLRRVTGRSSRDDRRAEPCGPRLERLVDDLRRLEAEYRKVEASDVPAKAARLHALSLAYDDTLRACCRALGLPEPQRPPLGAIARLQTEAVLAQHGLTW